MKGTVSRESLQKLKSAKAHLLQRKPTRSDIIMLTTGIQAPNLKNSGGIFQVSPILPEESSLK